MDEICSRLFWFFSLSVDLFILSDSLIQSICGMVISHHEHCSSKYILILAFFTDYFNHLFVYWRSRFLPFYFFSLSLFFPFFLFFFLFFFLHLFCFSFNVFFFFFFLQANRCSGRVYPKNPGPSILRVNRQHKSEKRDISTGIHPRSSVLSRTNFNAEASKSIFWWSKTI